MKSRHTLISHLEAFTEYPVTIFVVNRAIQYSDILVISHTSIIQDEVIQKFSDLLVGRNEDALFFKDSIGSFDVAFLLYEEYIERFDPSKIWKHHARLTNWSVGPWLLEGFWFDLQHSLVITDPLDCYSYYRSNVKDCQAVLKNYLTSEMKQKFAKYQIISQPAKEYLLQDIRLSYLRIIFLTQKKYFAGIYSLESATQSLAKSQQQQIFQILKAHKTHHLQALLSQFI